MVAKAHPDLDTTALRKAIERLTEKDQLNSVRNRAVAALEAIDNKTPAEAAKN